MLTLLTSSLFEINRQRFDNITEDARSFIANYWGNSIIGENIFNIITHFAAKKHIPLEILSYPFSDDELWAFTLKKKGTIFVCINSELSVNKQVFAAAHELYHIYRYSKNMDDTESSMASLLDSKTADECAENQEDIEANAFAAILLVPEHLLLEQIAFFNISKGNPSVDDILALMDSFGIPFKALVLRLYECALIEKRKALELLSYDANSIEKRSELTGKAKRWMKRNRGIENFGSLLETIEFNKEHDLLTARRIDDDENYIRSLRQSFEQK